MNISWLGLSCFEIVTKTTDGDIKIVTDPYANSTGLRFPRTLDANVVTVSHDDDDANQVAAIGGQPFIIDSPGEYEIKNVFVFTEIVPSKASPKNLVTRIESEQMSIVHLGALDRKLTDQELEKLDNVDILMLPIGGGRVLFAKDADQIITQIEPRVIIPMTYSLPNVKEKLDTVESFCKELGACRQESSNKLKITRKELPEDDRLIVVLTR